MQNLDAKAFLCLLQFLIFEGLFIPYSATVEQHQFGKSLDLDYFGYAILISKIQPLLLKRACIFVADSAGFHTFRFSSFNSGL
jgi:hypothetical protein